LGKKSQTQQIKELYPQEIVKAVLFLSSFSTRMTKMFWMMALSGVGGKIIELSCLFM